MQQFHSRRLLQPIHISEVTNEQELNVVPNTTAPDPMAPAKDATTLQNPPLFLVMGKYPVMPSGPLPMVSGPSNGASEAPSLIAALQSTMSPSRATTGRIVVIPGAKKRSQATTQELPVSPRRMQLRLRQGIVLGALLAVVVTTLISFAPLSNGHSLFPFTKNISNWVQSQTAYWLFQAQVAPAAPVDTTVNQAPAPASAPPPPIVLPQSQYIAIARQDAMNAGISPDYFVRQINLESGFDPNAVSPSGAVGIAQFLPSTAAGLGVNPWDPIQALRGAANVMASYSKNYGGNYAMALAAYNGGSGTVQYAVNNCGQANWLNCLPGETRNYIRVIMGI